jgi:sigma-B regulation protein RsbU (phosphoserine phosphatase)
MPTTMLGSLVMYVVFLRIGIVVLQAILDLFHRFEAASSLDGWGTALSVLLVFSASLLLLRWVRTRLLWSLRNRLIVTYMFIGVMPVVLILAMVGIAGYLIANQYAISQARLELDNQIQSLQTMNASVSAQIAEQISIASNRSERKLLPPEIRYLQKRFPGLEVEAYVDGKRIASSVTSSTEGTVELPAWLKSSFDGVVLDNGSLHLRSVAITKVGKQELTVLASVPLSDQVLAQAAKSLGAVKITTPVTEEAGEKRPELFVNRQAQSGEKQNQAASKTAPAPKKFTVRRDSKANVSAGAVPPPSKWPFDPPFNYATASPYTDWKTGQEAVAFLQVTTRNSVLMNRLFSSTGELAGVFVSILVGIAIFFGLIELVAVFFGVGLTRTITKSVSNLYRATQHINRGDLQHRIAVKTNDQLAALQTAFNGMTESLEKLLVEQKQKERLENELAIAQEVQATLFPQPLGDMRTLELHGICRPARTVSGDYYDFFSTSSAINQVGIAVGDISGKGISAALLMATIHAAVRAYQLGRMPAAEEFVRARSVVMAGEGQAVASASLDVVNGLQPPALVVELLNRHLFQSTQAEKYATLFLGVYDGDARTLTYSNAGHLPPLVLRRDGSVRRLDVGGTVIGLFENIGYEEASIVLEPRDIFIAYSDGMTEPENEFGEFGEERLIDIIYANRNLPLARISELAMAAVKDWIGAAEQPDDMTLVLARAK